MAISTVNVDFSAILQNAAQATGLLRVRLSQVGTVEDSETGDRVILPIAWQETTLTDGAATLALVPNKIIEPSCTYYEIQLKSVPDCPKACAKLLFSGIMYVPDEDCNVLDLLISPPSPETANTASGYASQAKQAAQVAENFAIQAGDRYDDVAEAAATALTDIGTAKQDALDAISTAQSGATEAISTAEDAALQAIGQARGTALDDIGTAQGTAIGAVQAEGNTQVGRVYDAGEDAVADVTAAQTTAVSAVQAQQATSVAAVTAEGTRQTGLVTAEGTAQVNAVTQAGNGYVSTMQGLVSDAQAARDAAQTAQGLAEDAQVAAESASTDAQGYAGDASTSAGQAAQSASDAATSATAAQASADSIAASAEQIQTNERNISNIQALLNGTLYREETDSTAAYSKTVPTGAMPYASINEIGARTVVWNQLVDSDTISVTLLAGHKYYAEISGTASIMTGAGTAQAVTGGTDIVIDLTMMFGSGNEPSSVAEFTAMFPTINPAYNAGQLISAGVTGAVSRGRNLLPLPASFKSVTNVGITVTSNADGSYTMSGTATAGVTISFELAEPLVLPDKNTAICYIHLHNSTSNSSVAFSLVSDNVAIAAPILLPMNRIVAIGDSAYGKTVTRIGVYVANGITVSGTIQPSVELTSDVTPFTPYRAPVSLPIPSAIQSLPGYGWSAGTVYNYIDFERKVYVQNVGSTKVGSMAWTNAHTQGAAPWPGTGGYYSVSSATYMKAALSDDNPGNIICSALATESRNDIRTNQKIGIGIGTSSYLALRVPEGKTARDYSDAVLYYELKNPIETDISSLLTDNLIEVEPGGSLTFKNQNGDDFRLPVPNEETFLVQATPELPTTDGTYTLQCTVTDGTPSVTWVTA